MRELIDRQAAIRWVKTECNPYGNPTLDFESGKKVIEHLEQMPSQPTIDAVEVVRCRECKWWMSLFSNDELGVCGISWGLFERHKNDFCSRGKRRTNETD